MNEQQSLLAAVISNPDEDLPRLMYADYLQDSDNELDRALGKYIKLSLELSTHRKLIKPRVDVAAKGVQLRNDGYHGIDSYKWYQRGIELDKEIKYLEANSVQHHPSWKFTYSYLHFTITFGFDRGFISSISCTATQFLEVEDKLIWHESMVDKCKDGMKWIACHTKIPIPCPLTAHPIKEIEITDYHIGGEHTVGIREWREELAPKYGIKFIITDE